MSHKARNKKYVDDFKDCHPCELCGETNPIVLEFHHRDPATKRYTISQLVTRNASITVLAAELKKCAVLCANCHKIIHHAMEHDD